MDPIKGTPVYVKFKCELFELYENAKPLFLNLNETEQKIKNPLSNRMVSKSGLIGKVIMRLKTHIESD